MNERTQPLNVLIVGGGVAALEAGLALRDLAGDLVKVTVLAPNEDFVYRPMVVREPFGYREAQRYPLRAIARDIGAELVVDSFKWLEADARLVHTEGGSSLGYDALLLALGARMHPRFHHAITLDYRELDDRLHGLIQDVEGGYVRSLAFVVPDPMPWPLPVYELAMMMAGRAADMGADLSVTVVTPEDSPLALFGQPVSQAVQELLKQNGVGVITSAHSEVASAGVVAIHPGDRTLKVDRIVALPELYGPATAGVPKDTAAGFIPVGPHCEVRGLSDVYAAGDATAFPVKHGAVAAQQADTAAQAIAARAGADIETPPFSPVIHGVLLGGHKPLYMSAHVTGGHGSSGTVSETPPEEGAAKIHARYLGPYLEQRGGVLERTR